MQELVNSQESEIELQSDYLYNVNDNLENGVEISHDLTINGNGHKIDGNGKARIFKIINNAIVTFNDINFVKGNTTGQAYGAAIWVDSGSAKAINCNFTENQAYYGAAVSNINAENCIFTDNYGYVGGALYNSNATNCIIKNNKAQFQGGAMATDENHQKEYLAIGCTFINNSAINNAGALLIGNAKNCIFINNTVTGNFDNANGGAIYKGNTTNCNFTGNSAVKNGGAIYNGSAINCIFTGNSAGNNGGAIYNGNATNSTFINNTATNEYGGAIYNGSAVNCIFTGNSAGKDGGAIYNDDENNRVATNCTFTGNSAGNNDNRSQGGALYKVAAKDCKFTGNKAGSEGNGGAMSYASAENCIFTNNSAIYGGAIYEGNATNCSFTGNYAQSGGGAMYNSDENNPGVAADCNFTENRAYYGGALYGFNATSCKFIGNNAERNGGAMYQGNAINSTFAQNFAEEEGGAISFVNASNCNFTKNMAKLGGAAANRAAENCIFTNNKATEKGGAMYEGKATNCTFQLNAAPEDKDMSGVTYDICKIVVPVFSASDLNTKYGYGDKFNFTLTAGNQVFDDVDAIISIYKNGAFVANYSASSSQGWTVDLPVGTYTAVLNVPDSDVAALNKTINVAKIPTKIDANAVTAIYNKNNYLVIKLVDEKGNALSGVKVTVTLGSAKTYTTDKNGQIKINVGKLVPKTYTAKISFAGNANYFASSTTAKVVVKKATAKMTAKKKTFKRKVKVKKYTITLKNNVGKAIKGVKVTLKVNKKTYKATTNKKGKAVFKIKKLTKKGKYTAVIKFAGNKYYNKLSKKVKITVKK